MVVLYFPYNISLRAFIAEEKLQVKPDPGCLFLRTYLKDEQIERACAVYGAELHS
jgi:hypothetical protein